MPPKIIVTGCLAQRYSAYVEHSMPHADLWLGFEKYAELPERLNQLLEPPANESAPPSGGPASDVSVPAASAAASLQQPECPAAQQLDERNSRSAGAGGGSELGTAEVATDVASALDATA